MIFPSRQQGNRIALAVFQLFFAPGLINCRLANSIQVQIPEVAVSAALIRKGYPLCCRSGLGELLP